MLPSAIWTGGWSGRNSPNSTSKATALRALRGKFLDQPAIDLARPVKADNLGYPSSPFCTAAMLESSHGDKGEIGGDGRGKMQGGSRRASRRSCAPAARKNPSSQQPQAANERENGERPEGPARV